MKMGVISSLAPAINSELIVILLGCMKLTFGPEACRDHTKLEGLTMVPSSAPRR